MIDRNTAGGGRVPLWILDSRLARADGRRSQAILVGSEVGATVQLEPGRCRANLEHGGVSGGAREPLAPAILELSVPKCTRRPASLLLCYSVAQVKFL